MSEQEQQEIIGEEIDYETLKIDVDRKSKFVKIDDGDNKTLYFHDKGRKVTEDDKFNPGQKRVRIYFDVTDMETQSRKKYTTTERDALKIVEHLRNGAKALKATRTGEGRKTQYSYKPVPVT